MHATLDCSSLGTLVVIEVEVHEEISQPTRARALVQTEAPLTALDSAVGASAKVTFFSQEKAARTFALIVTGVTAIDTDTGDVRYLVELAHALTLLSFRRDTRIFTSMTAQDIVKKVLTGAGFSPSVSWSVSRTLAPRDTCAQHRESDFDFVARLLAEEGIFFTAKDGDGALVMSDQSSAAPAIEGATTIAFSAENRGEGVRSFEVTHTMVSDVFTTTDWNEQTPGVDLRSTNVISTKKASEIFEYPGVYLTQTVGAALAKIRAEEIASQSVRAEGTSVAFQFTAGSTFELSPAPTSIAKKYLLLAVTHRATSADADEYGNAFTCTPLDLTLRPSRAKRPQIAGAHAIEVTGAAGDEIHTDAMGRLRGLFAFDRVSKKDDTASSWIRVAQPMMGGAMTLARVGWEMAVRYLDGASEKPVAVARLFDGTHVPPETLPASQTMTNVQSPSSPNAQHRNAITIDDKGGSMMFTVLAAKDFDATVVNDRSETIGADETVTVGQDQTTVIGGKQTITISGDASITASKDAGVAIAKDREKSLSGDESIEIGQKFSLSVGGDETETTSGARKLSADSQITETVEGAHNCTVGGAFKTYAAKDYEIYVAGKSTETVQGARTITSSNGVLTESIGGDASITIGAARSETVTGKRITSVVGQSSLTIGAAATITASGKLQIKASKIKLTIGGAGNLIGGGGILTLTPASLVLVGMVTIKGSGGVELSGAPGMAG